MTGPKPARSTAGTLCKEFILKIRLFFLIVLYIAIACSSYGGDVDYVSPLTQIPARGVSLTSPEEKGWFIIDPDGKGAYLAKVGATKSETYAIAITYFESINFKSEKEFLDSVKQRNRASSERFKIRTANEELNRLRGPYFVNYYSLAEDSGAHQMPKGKSFAIIEIMGFYARHPNDPGRLVKVEYSYRYYPGNEDSEFKKKAEWVLDHATFTTP